MTEITCIICPLGCQIQIHQFGNELKISGHTCPRGEAYARDETFAPKRMLTGVVAVEGRSAMLPVKTKSPIPKSSLREAMAEIRTVYVKAPVIIGDVLINNLAGTGIELIATKNLP